LAGHGHAVNTQSSRRIRLVIAAGSDLVPFRMAFNGADAVMVGHLRSKGLTKQGSLRHVASTVAAA
jgi:hypothetical protein